MYKSTHPYGSFLCQPYSLVREAELYDIAGEQWKGRQHASPSCADLSPTEHRPALTVGTKDCIFK